MPQASRASLAPSPSNPRDAAAFDTRRSSIAGTTFTTEQCIILEAIRLPGSDDGPLRELLAAPVDWRVLRDTAIVQGVLPTVAGRLRAVGEDLLPGEILSELKALQVGAARLNLWLTGRLLRALAQLEAHGIEAQPLKGPVLALQSYADLAMRHFCDLDILIRPGQLDAARSALAELGYRPSPPLDTPEARMLLRADNECTLVDDNGSLDVHWRLCERYLHLNLAPDLLWQGCVPLDLLGRRVRVLSPENTLLMLAVNGVREEWRYLRRTLDMAYTWRSLSQTDCASALALARKTGAYRILATGLALAADLVGISLPPAVEAEIRLDRAVAGLAEEAKARLFEETVSSTTFSSFFRRSRERWFDRLACLLAPNPRDWAVLDLPDSLGWLYYAVRPLRLATDSVSRAVRPAHR